MTFRKIPRDLNEDARDVARAIAETPEYERSRHRRKKVEMLFAHLKRILRLGRLRLRGPSGARDEFLLAATAQNLRRLAKLGPGPTARWPLPSHEGGIAATEHSTNSGARETGASIGGASAPEPFWRRDND